MFTQGKKAFKILRKKRGKPSFLSSRLGKSIQTLLASIIVLGGIAYGSLQLYKYYISDANVSNDVETLCAKLSTGDLNEQLACFALKRTEKEVILNKQLPTLTYPLGDVPLNMGMAADLIVRAYRSIGFDFQQAIHEDLLANFEHYPKLWDFQPPNPSVDHRRLENILYYISQHGQVLSKSTDPSELQIGDIVAWRLPNGDVHAGFLTPVKTTENQEQFWVVHNLDEGPVWANDLKRFSVIAYYRFIPNISNE